jgi:hypothetical protein
MKSNLPPSNLTKEEVKYWKETEIVASGLLDELNNGKWLKMETEWGTVPISQLFEMTRLFNAHMETATALSIAFESKRLAITAALVNLGVGFTPQNVTTISVYDILGVFVENTELLKNYFLILLRMDGKTFKPDMTLGWLTRSLEDVCPTYGHKFVKEIEVDLRNSLSYGLYWFRKDVSGNDVLCYIEEFGLTPKDIPASEIRDFVRKANLLTGSFVELIGNRATGGYFK